MFPTSFQVFHIVIMCLVMLCSKPARYIKLHRTNCYRNPGFVFLTKREYKLLLTTTSMLL